ncbi:MAG: ribulose-phosphate 3-epimerase [candidate division Zixibacteria bacterium]|nr:ribulose-phosphate 3-epimerase [candidate division Zixibacteria bacterium]
MAKIAPSVLGADFARLGEEITSADKAGVDTLHLDIMDGHFVPNISYGPAIVKTIDKLSDSFLDVHLMLSEPEKYFEAFVKSGADAITFHLEVHPNPSAYARQIKALGVQAGISINPDMPVERVLPFLKDFDYLLIMSVYPGFGGQKFIRESLTSVKTASEYIESHGLKTVVMIDGGVDASNAQEVVAAGAEILVMGSAFFGTDDRAALVKQVAAYS